MASSQRISCWIFAFVSSLAYVIISYTTLLYVDAFLNILYATLAIVGWVNWNKKKQIHAIRTISWKTHALIVLGSCLLGAITGYALDNYTHQVFPYLDAVLFFLSISATWMITRKILENWIYFIVIDSAMVGIYFNRSLYLSSLLFILYTFFAIHGYYLWRKEMRKMQLIN